MKNSENGKRIASLALRKTMLKNSKSKKAASNSGMELQGKEGKGSGERILAKKVSIIAKKKTRKFVKASSSTTATPTSKEDAQLTAQRHRNSEIHAVLAGTKVNLKRSALSTERRARLLVTVITVLCLICLALEAAFNFPGGSTLCIILGCTPAIGLPIMTLLSRLGCVNFDDQNYVPRWLYSFMFLGYISLLMQRLLAQVASSCSMRGIWSFEPGEDVDAYARALQKSNPECIQNCPIGTIYRFQSYGAYGNTTLVRTRAVCMERLFSMGSILLIITLFVMMRMSSTSVLNASNLDRIARRKFDTLRRKWPLVTNMLHPLQIEQLLWSQKFSLSECVVGASLGLATSSSAIVDLVFVFEHRCQQRTSFSFAWVFSVISASESCSM